MERSTEILNELNAISPVVSSIGSGNVFIVPQGYFETVPDMVLACVKDEVPAGYFDTLSNNILSKINGTVAHELQEISPFIANIKKVTPYEVPENYFEKVADDTNLLVADENIPAVLQGANNVQPFKVPAGYFDQLADDILKKAKEQSSAKVITMPKRRSAIVRYAVAAAFTGMAALGIYKYVDSSANSIGVPVAVMDDKKFDETLNNLNEEDIIKYLEKNGSEEDLAALSSGIDEKDLPDQEEYFTDETTLDKFLQDIDSKN